ncbi:arachidonate 5-lipoxygenase [Fusarium bulbicola]|nr:arachidonate 5-lipoxygenase [Fusarium bulbicola]
MEKTIHSLWQKSVPRGLADGVLRNAKSDLYFSMERLSVHPESLRRVKQDEHVALRVQDSIARKITTKTQRSLQKEGRLFIVDHSSLANLTLTKGRYAGACEALFFIHPTSGDFLPLAIHPNNGWYHPAAAHISSDLIYMSATRSFSDMHPVWGLIRRVAVNSFACRPGASATLVNPGGDIEKNFAWNGGQAIKYSKQEWKTECAPWQANYLEAKLKRRGLIECNYGPELKSFPYYEDASVILGALRTFINAYVHAYYPSDAAITADKELVAWFHEAAHAASLVDFPDSISTRSELVASSALQRSFANAPVVALQTVTEAKGISSLVPFLPDLEASIQHIALVASFNRGQIGNTTDSLHLLFEEPQFHSRINKEARAAVEVYSATLSRFSKDAKGRTLDGDGYSQGMPFVWNLYDPSTAPGILAA